MSDVPDYDEAEENPAGASGYDVSPMHYGDDLIKYDSLLVGC